MIGLTQNYASGQVHHDFFTFSTAFDTFKTVCKTAEDDEKNIVLTYDDDKEYGKRKN